jgi:hypothetical protein
MLTDSNVVRRRTNLSRPVLGKPPETDKGKRGTNYIANANANA